MKCLESCTFKNDFYICIDPDRSHLSVRDINKNYFRKIHLFSQSFSIYFVPNGVRPNTGCQEYQNKKACFPSLGAHSLPLL